MVEFLFLQKWIKNILALHDLVIVDPIYDISKKSESFDTTIS